MFELRKVQQNHLDLEAKRRIQKAMRLGQYVTNEEKLKLECTDLKDAVECLGFEIEML